MPCCVEVNCSNRSNTHESSVRLFRFPRDKSHKTRCALWITKVKRDNWKPTLSSYLCEKHFDESQFESHRQDGWRKLRPNAVPTLLPHIPPVRVRKPPAKRSPQVSPSKHLLQRRVSIEHTYCTSFSTSSSSNAESSCAQHVNDINDTNMDDFVANPSTWITVTPIDDQHSSTCSSSTTASNPTVAANCVTCQTLQSNIDRLQKQLALKNRLLWELRRKHKASLRKIRKVATEKIAYGGAVNNFRNNDQQKYLSRPWFGVDMLGLHC